MQLPPMCPARSMTPMRLPKYAAWAPPFSPAGPQPITIRSKLSLAVTNSSAEFSLVDQLSASRRIVGEEDKRRGSFLLERAGLFPSQKPIPSKLGANGANQGRSSIFQLTSAERL